MVILPDIGHGRAAQASTMAAVNWLADHFAGKGQIELSRELADGTASAADRALTKAIDVLVGPAGLEPATRPL